MSAFPEKLYCNVEEVDGGDFNVLAYNNLITAAREGEYQNSPVRVGIYQLVEVVDATVVESVETTKVVE